MTQPDKWDEMAGEMTRCWYRDAAQEYVIDTQQIATALRSAYAEGERAGMEKTLKLRFLANCYADKPDEYTRQDLLQEAIRAAKETKE